MKQYHDDGIALSESLYLLHSNIITDSYKISLYDALKGENVKQWDYSDDVITFFHHSAKKFFRMPDGAILIAGDGYSPYIFGIDKDGKNFYKAIEFKYNDRTITDHVTVDDFRKNHSVSEKYFYTNELPMGQYANSKKIVTTILSGPDVHADLYTIVTDRNTGKSYRIEKANEVNAAMPKIMTIDEDYLYSVYTKQNILENPGYVLNKAAEADSLLAGIDDEDFVLIKYRFKK